MKRCIVTGGTKDQSFAMAVLAMNIRDTSPDIADELVIYHDGISKKEQNAIHSIFPTRFILYKSPFNSVSNFSKEVSEYFSLMVFCKYECIRLAKEYKYVIWTDYDVLIQQNISSLFSQIEESQFIFSKASKIIDAFKSEEVKNLEPSFDFSADGLCCGLFVIHNNFENKDEFYNWCLRKTISYASILRFPEQAIMALALQHFNSNYSIFPEQEEKYACHPNNENLTAINPYILHCYGQPKFWNGLYNSQWDSYYKNWIKLYSQKTLFKTILKKSIKKIFKYFSILLPYGVIKIVQIAKKTNKPEQIEEYKFYNSPKKFYIEKPVAQLHGTEKIFMGDNFTANKGLYLCTYGEKKSPIIEISDNCFFNYDSIITGINHIVIGKNFLGGPRIYISDHSHGKIDESELMIPPGDRSLYSKGPVIIGDNVWVGAGSCILPNVTIGNNCIIGANSVVTKSFPDNCVIAGNPAKIIKQL